MMTFLNLKMARYELATTRREASPLRALAVRRYRAAKAAIGMEPSDGLVAIESVARILAAFACPYGCAGFADKDSRCLDCE